MTVYIIFLFLFILSSYLEVIHHKHYNWWWIVIFFAIIIVGFRYEVGSDWAGYVSYYDKNRYDTWNTIVNGEFEPMYMILMLFSKALGFNSQVFLTLFSSISIGVLIIAIKRLCGSYYCTSFLLYYCLHFFQFQFNMIRHGMAASFIVLSIYYVYKHEKKKFLLCILIAFLFHKTAIPFVCLYFFDRFNLSKIRMLFLGVCAGLIYIYVSVSGLLDALPLFQDKIDYYLYDYYGGHIEDFAYGISLGLLFLCFLSFFARFGPTKSFYDDDNLYKVLVNIAFVAFLISVSFNQIPIIVERYVSILNTVIIILFPYLFYGFKNNKKRFVLWSLIIIYCVLLFSKNLAINPETKTNQFIPYKMRII